MDMRERESEAERQERVKRISRQIEEFLREEAKQLRNRFAL